ncbi:type II toxin-antitoxin system Phd/YefM family antitoxin [Brevundimonas naejangsanensis]|uniref:Antitoxin n=1 Tax=Brevundimonas naejangsanensis TaxID=588932 RepID=A0A494RLP8_9CAUL|nr:type II toxin-antitoxin system Phd/YefM family antitoxin [Brevundimonas naejangsanensis]AYG94892.1 type II toxin-antitoxin system Phd/YefM family antitoxin [Brevundimonas naejangsanensis]
MSWSVAKAKDNLSEVIRRSRSEGPQEISLHGEAAAVVLSAEDFRRLKDPRAAHDFKDWLLNGPSLEGVDLERDRRPTRDIDPL